MLNQILAISIKELKVLSRDRGALMALFIIPIAFILVMTTALQGVFDAGSSDNPISLLVVNEDRGPIGAEVVAELRSTDSLKLVEEIDGRHLTRQAAEDLIKQRAYTIALVLPSDLSSAIQAAVSDTRSLNASVTLITDPTVGSQLTSPVRGMVESFVERKAGAAQAPLRVRYGMDFIAAALPPAQVGLAEAIRDQLTKDMQAYQSQDYRSGVAYQLTSPALPPAARAPSSVEQNVPGYTLYGVFFIMQTIATSLFREKDQGTLRRLQAAPINRAAFLIGKLLPYYLINLIQIALMFTVGILVFHLNLGSDPLALVLLSLVTSAVATGLGLLLAALGKTVEQVSSLGTVLSIVLAAVGGMMVPVYVMPAFMQKLAYITPHAWALSGFQDVMVRGQGLAEVLPAMGILMAYAVAFWGLAVWRYRMD